jgi:Cu-processing system permease protein
MITIAKLSFKETLYKRIFLIALLMTLAFLIFFGAANHYASKESAEQLSFAGVEVGQVLLENTFIATQVLSVGLFFANFITILLTILSTVGSVSGEIESHQIDTLLVRPLKRRDLILGKFLGLSGLMMCYSLFLFGGVILMNQLFGGLIAVHLSSLQILKAGLLFMLLPLIVASLALWLSARFTTINGGIILIVLYGISFVGGFLEQFGAFLKNQALENIGILTSLLFPLDALFRRVTVFLFDVADSPLSFASQGMFGSINPPSGAMLVYSVLYGVVILFFAVRKFSQRDV